MKMSHGLAALTLVLAAGNCAAGDWGLGIGVAAQHPPQDGADTDVVVLPFPSYEGERLRLDFGSASYALAKTDRFRFSIEGQLRFDGYDPNESDALSGLEERDVTLDAGFSVTVTDSWGIASVKVLGDALGVHKGYEVSASYHLPFQVGRWTFVPGVTVKRPSAELVEYYYGVQADEARAGRPAYEGKSVTNIAAAFHGAFSLTEHWEIIGGAEYTRLGDGIKDSPIIVEDHEVIMYSAIIYNF